MNYIGVTNETITNGSVVVWHNWAFRVANNRLVWLGSYRKKDEDGNSRIAIPCDRVIYSNPFRYYDYYELTCLFTDRDPCVPFSATHTLEVHPVPYDIHTQHDYYNTHFVTVDHTRNLYVQVWHNSDYKTMKNPKQNIYLHMHKFETPKQAVESGKLCLLRANIRDFAANSYYWKDGKAVDCYSIMWQQIRDLDPTIEGKQ